MQEWFDAIR
jgi:hypothetical protein